MSDSKSLTKYRLLGKEIMRENVEGEEGERGGKGERRRNPCPITRQQASQDSNP